MKYGFKITWHIIKQFYGKTCANCGLQWNEDFIDIGWWVIINKPYCPVCAEFILSPNKDINLDLFDPPYWNPDTDYLGDDSIATYDEW